MDLTKPGGFASAAACECSDCCDEPIDPTLDVCCARDEVERRRAAGWMKKLREHDPTRTRGALREAAIATLAAQGASLMGEERPQRAAADDDAEEKDDDDDDDSSDEDFSDEESDDDYEDEDLVSRLVAARLREARKRLVVLGTESEVRVESGRRERLVVLVENQEEPLSQHVTAALEDLAAEDAYEGCGFARSAPAAVATFVLDARAAAPQAGGLVVFARGRVVAVRALRDFADDAGAATDAIDTFLERTGMKQQDRRLDDDDEALDPEDDDDDGQPLFVPFPCGKPGCMKPFHHTHVDTSKSVPVEWDVDRRRALG